MNRKLLVRYMSRETSAVETATVDQWRKASPENEKVFGEYHQLWQKEHYHTLLTTEELNHDWHLICRRMGKGRKITLAPDSIWSAFSRVAAMVVLMLAVSGALWTYWNVPGFGRWTSFKTGAFVDSLELPDNSMVFLNRYSSLTYRNNFGESQREVTLDGEGYFEVTSDALHPFRVEAGNQLAVEVVGTAFHINASAKVSDFELNVTNGTVLFHHSHSSRSVVAGHSARVTDEGIEVKPIESTNFISWKTGEIEIVGQSLKQIIGILKKHYSQIQEVRLTTSSDVLVTTRFKNQPLSEVLDELAIHFDKKFLFDEGVLTISD